MYSETYGTIKELVVLDIQLNKGLKVRNFQSYALSEVSYKIVCNYVKWIMKRRRRWMQNLLAVVVVEPRVDNKDVHIHISFFILHSLVTSYLDLPLHGSHGSAR